MRRILCVILAMLCACAAFAEGRGKEEAMLTMTVGETPVQAAWEANESVDAPAGSGDEIITIAVTDGTTF